MQGFGQPGHAPSLDGKAVGGHVGMTGGVPWAQDPSAKVLRDSHELGGMQVEGLSHLHSELAAPVAWGWDGMESHVTEVWPWPFSI